MPGDTLRHWKAPAFGYFRLAKEVHAAEVCAFVHLSPFLFFLKKSRCKNTKQSDNFFRILKNNQKNMKQCEKVWRMCCVAPFGSPSARRGNVAKKKAAMENGGLDIPSSKL